MDAWKTLFEAIYEADADGGDVGYDKNKNVTAVLNSSEIGQFYPRDFLELAKACLDQAGLDSSVQKKICDMIDKHMPEDDDSMACPGCGSKPGEGRGKNCSHPEGCGYR